MFRTLHLKPDFSLSQCHFFQCKLSMQIRLDLDWAIFTFNLPGTINTMLFPPVEFCLKEAFVYIFKPSCQQWFIKWWSNDGEAHYNQAFIQACDLGWNFNILKCQLWPLDHSAVMLDRSSKVCQIAVVSCMFHNLVSQLHDGNCTMQISLGLG